MAGSNGYTVTPHHRQNRRRERPGSRTRRTITRKSNFQSEYTEGLLDALDTSVPLPSDKARPSPLMRQNFDESWKRWKAREAEERQALAEMDRLQFEQEQQRQLFGGDVDDDDLYRMGILYDEESSSITKTFPFRDSVYGAAIPLVEHSAPLFIIRQGKPRRSRRSKWRSISLYLSLSNLQDDIDIARLLSPSQPPLNNNSSTIQHRAPPPPCVATLARTETPLSLPTSTAMGSASVSTSSPTQGSTSIPSPNLILKPDNTPTSTTPHSLEPFEWTFISSTTQHDEIPSLLSPYSDTETWILCDDS